MDYGFISPHTRRHLALRFWAAGPDQYSKMQESSVTIKCGFTRDGGFGRCFCFMPNVRSWPISVVHIAGRERQQLLQLRPPQILRERRFRTESRHSDSGGYISPRTVETHRNRLMGKLEIKTLADVVRYAVRTGIVS